MHLWVVELYEMLLYLLVLKYLDKLYFGALAALFLRRSPRKAVLDEIEKY